MDRRQLGRGQRALVTTVVVGTIVIALIGFVGSYDAVLRLAQRGGFGWFSYLLPIGIDVGITVFLALDLLLTWMQIPLPLLRQLAWVLTAATIVFNAASAWPHLLSSGMHAIVPLLFVAAIEAARHTVGRIAQIQADRLFEGTRLGRWLWSPLATLRLWRRRVLWELRSYDEALEMERRRLVYRARLRATHGRLWRHRAPVEQVLLLRLANLGEPLPDFTLDTTTTHPTPAQALPGGDPVLAALPRPRREQQGQADDAAAVTAASSAEFSSPAVTGQAQTRPTTAPPTGEAGRRRRPVASAAGRPAVQDRGRPGGSQEADDAHAEAPPRAIPSPDAAPAVSVPAPPRGSAVDRYRTAFQDYTHRHGTFPDGEQLAKWLLEEYGISGRTGNALHPGHLRRYLPAFKNHWTTLQQDHPGPR